MPLEPECHSQASSFRCIFVELFNIFFSIHNYYYFELLYAEL